MKRWTIALVAGILAGHGPHAAAEWILAEGGKVQAPIVVAQSAPPFTRLAVEELADYIEKVCGARPAVLEGAPDPVPAHAIWVGVQPVHETLFPDLDLGFEHPEEIVLAATDDHVIIAGRDRWTPGDEMQQEYGTANAVYTFLQEHLDVRWIWPGELGEDVIRRDRIAFAPFHYRHHPQIRSRGGIFNYSRLGRGGGYGHSQDWVRRQRIQLDSLTVPGGHGFADWWARFHATHPDYFALQPDGTRSGYPSPRTAKLCKSNPEVWNQWMAEVARQLEENPLQTVFDASANDSWASGYCVCENCRAWDHPDGEPRRFMWEGFGQEYVAMSDRQVHFANALARKLKARYPAKDYFVKISAYGHSRPAPIAAVPDDNVLVASVANFLTRPYDTDRGSLRGTLHRDQFRAWGKIAPHLFWRPNKSRRMASMPIVPVRQTLQDLQFVADNRCIGIYIDMVWEHWATRGPLYYVIAQMAWNPRQDGLKMLDDYYRRGFGAAADDVRGYWDFMEDTWKTTLDANPGQTELFDADFFARAQGYLDRARQAVEGHPEVYARRVDFVGIGLRYTRLVTEAHEMMLRFNESGGQDKAAEARAKTIWLEEIKALADNDETPHAINWGPTRPGHGHMKSGLHPKGLPRIW